MLALETNELTKTYQSLRRSRIVFALQDVSIHVQQGAIFGLLGPNGAGKTTLVKTVLGILHPTQGIARLFGEYSNHPRIRERVGFLPENHRFPDHLTGEGLLNLMARLNGLSVRESRARIDILLEQVEMTKWRKIRIKKYSKGMMQRIGLAQAMIQNPDLLILDEPTDGVDPKGRKEIRDIILRLKKEGKTVFLNSHLLSELEMVCDEVAILNHGRLVKEGKVQDMVAAENEYQIEFGQRASESLKEKINTTAIRTEWKENSLHLWSGDLKEVNELIDMIRASGNLIRSITPHKISLEDYFIQTIEEEGTI
jgi:ABC-2 type transport system ATP-binding protein